MLVHDASLLWHLKDFFGFKALTPFEEALIDGLSHRLSEENKLALTSQLNCIRRCARLIKPIPGKIGSYGYSEFYTRKNDSNFLPFAMDESIKVVASTMVVFDEGSINVRFTQFEKRLFIIKFTGNKNSYYPPAGNYKLTKFEVFI